MDDDNTSGGINIHVGNGSVKAGVAGNLGGTSVLKTFNVSEEDTKNLSESIKKLSGAAEQISKMAELSKLPRNTGQCSRHVRKYGTFQPRHQLADQRIQTSLNESITDNSDGINQNSRGYVQQMGMFNRNISGF